MICCVFYINYIIYHFTVVEDVDGDNAHCRWSESSLGECAGVCRRFPATLNLDHKLKSFGFADIVRQTSTISYNKASWNQGLLFEV